MGRRRPIITLIGSDADLLSSASSSSGFACSTSRDPDSAACESFAKIDRFMPDGWVASYVSRNPLWFTYPSDGALSGELRAKNPLPEVRRLASCSIVVDCFSDSLKPIDTIESIKKRTSFPYRDLVIVSNQSNDALYSEIVSRIDYRDLPVSVGSEGSAYRRAITGITKAFSKGVDSVCYVASGCLVTDGWLYRMLHCQSLNDAAMVSPSGNNYGTLRMPMSLSMHMGAEPVSRPLSYINVAECLSICVPRHPMMSESPHSCFLITRPLWESFISQIEGRKMSRSISTDIWSHCVETSRQAKCSDTSYVYTSGFRDRSVFMSSADRSLRSRASMRRSDDTFRSAKSSILSARPKTFQVHMMMSSIGYWGGIIAPMRICQELNELGMNSSAFYLRMRGQAWMPTSWDLSFSPYKLSGIQELQGFSSLVGTDTGYLVSTHVFAQQMIEIAARSGRDFRRVSFWQDREDMFLNSESNTRLTETHMENFASSDLNVFNSEWVMSSARDDFGPIPGRKIPIGVDTQSICPNVYKNNDKYRILSMWRPHTPRRGHLTLLNLYKEIKASLGGLVSLEVYGEEAGNSEIMSIVDKHHGWLDRAKLCELLPNIDIVIEPSEFQGFGMPGLEAMAAGCVLISTDNMGIHEYGVNGVNCLIEQDKSRLFDSVVRCLDDRATSRLLAFNARETALMFDWKNVGSKWAKMIIDSDSHEGLYSESLKDSIRSRIADRRPSSY